MTGVACVFDQDFMDVALEVGIGACTLHGTGNDAAFVCRFGAYPALVCAANHDVLLLCHGCPPVCWCGCQCWALGRCFRAKASL